MNAALAWWRPLEQLGLSPTPGEDVSGYIGPVTRDVGSEWADLPMIAQLGRLGTNIPQPRDPSDISAARSVFRNSASSRPCTGLHTTLGGGPVAE